MKRKKSGKNKWVGADHRHQHLFLTSASCTRVRDRIVGSGCLDQPREQTRLREVQPRGRASEVTPSGGCDPDRSLTEVGGVQVGVQDLRLAVGAFDLDRQRGILCLAPR